MTVERVLLAITTVLMLLEAGLLTRSVRVSSRLADLAVRCEQQTPFISFRR